MSNPKAPRRRQGFAVASLILGILGLPTVGLAVIGAMIGIVLGVAVLLKGDVATTTSRNGYNRRFYSGPAPMPPPSKPVSRSSMTAFAYVAVPIQRGKTGVRSFCVDASGDIRTQADEAEPEIVDGAC